MAKEISISKLKEQYENICDQYIQKFVKKQGYEFDGWVGQEVGGVAGFIEQYFFSLDDIMLDINSKAEKGLIFKWQEDSVEQHDKDKFSTMNYKSYIMGLRYSSLKDIS